MGILEQHNALVTGAGQGVGRGIALALAKEGARILVAGRTRAKLEKVCGEIHAAGGEAWPQVVDVGDAAQIRDCVAEAARRFEGRLHILVNNAQEVPLGRLLEVSEKRYLRGMETGPHATLRFMRACHPLLKGGAVIINLGSGASRRWDPSGFGAYGAVKEAVRSLSRAAACEWAADGIRVNCILPMALSPAMEEWRKMDADADTTVRAMIPQGRLGDCEKDIGRAVVFLCGPDASYITGHTLPLDGGMVLLG